MARTTPRPAPTQEQRLETWHPACPSGGRLMWFADEDRRPVTTLEAVTRLRLPIRRCENGAGERYPVAYRPEAEGRWALPKHEFGLDVIAWIGVLRYGEHRRVPEIHRRWRERGVVIAERTVEH